MKPIPDFILQHELALGFWYRLFRSFFQAVHAVQDILSCGLDKVTQDCLVNVKVSVKRSFTDNVMMSNISNKAKAQKCISQNAERKTNIIL